MPRSIVGTLAAPGSYLEHGVLRIRSGSELCAVGTVVPFKSKTCPPPASVATRPNKPPFRVANEPVAYRAIDGWPIHWRDHHGIIHACEACEVHPGHTLAWTLCRQDVDYNAEHIAADLNEVTCPECAKERWTPRTAVAPELWGADYKRKD
jgi:hypothetical protein